MSDQVVVSKAEGVYEIQLNRPEKRNAITLAMYGALVEALNEARADDTVRVVLLSGAGASFTAGNDLNDFIGQTDFGDTNDAIRLLRLLPSFTVICPSPETHPTRRARAARRGRGCGIRP